MRFSLFVEQKLREKSGFRLSTASDIEKLVHDIESETREHVGVNTVKRLLCYLPDEREPRVGTLDVIARYLGFDTWKQLQEVEGKSNSMWGTNGNEIDVASLPTGKTIVINYRPDRRLVLRQAHGTTLNVIESVNSKLRAGDVIDVTTIIKGYPLIIDNVRRNGRDKGRFVAGQLQGITFEIID